MRVETGRCAWRLPSGVPLRLSDARGEVIFCLDGTLWITEAGTTEDIFLAAGERHAIRGSGLILIEAVGDVAALASVRNAKPDRPSRRPSGSTLWEWTLRISRTTRAASGAGFPA